MNLSWITVSLDLLLISLQLYIEARFTSLYIRTNKPVLFCLLYVLISTAGYGVVEYFFPEFKAIKMLALPIIIILLVVLFRKRSLLRSILWPVVLHICLLGLDYLTIVFLQISLPDYMDKIMGLSVRGGISAGSVEFSFLLLIRILGIVEAFIGVLLTYFLLREKKDTDDTIGKRMNQFVPIFILEIIFTGFLMFFTARTTITDTTVIWLMFGFLVLFYVLDLLVLRMLRSVETAELLRHEKAELALSASAADAAYNQIVESTTRFRMQRHDMLNQLQTARVLLERGDTNTAVKQLQNYEDDIIDSGKAITGNRIVDAVISIKESTCAQSGIKLDVSGKLPDTTPLDNVKLCGVVGNILDNAIHAVNEIKELSEKVIHFSSTVQGNKLVVSCKNPTTASEEHKSLDLDIDHEHGWGLHILEKTASEHGGAFTLTIENGNASALFWIPFSEAE